MKRVDKHHILALDTKTDMSHLIAIKDSNQTPILSFDNSLNCFDSSGKIIARIKSDKNKNWIMPNDFGIYIDPVPQNMRESVFEVESQFSKEWLEFQSL